MCGPLVNGHGGAPEEEPTLRLMILTCAILSAAGLMACQPTEEETPESAASATQAAQDTAAMATAGGTMTSSDPTTADNPAIDDATTSPASPDGAIAPGQTPPTLPSEPGAESPPPQ